MADGTHIEWTDATWNPITGCTLVSDGCRNCYAAQLAATRLRDHPSRKGLARLNAGGVAKFTGEVRFNEKWLDQPLRWKQPRMIFVCAHGDLFHESVPDEWIDQIFAVMALAPQHIFQVLTKRPERMRDYFQKMRHEGGHCDSMAIIWQRALDLCTDFNVWKNYQPSRKYLPNVWLGTSVEDQATANDRIPVLLETPAAVRWISAEPLLGPIDLEIAWDGETALDSECWGDCAWCKNGHPPLHNCQRGLGDWERGISGIDWVVAGGESGRNARPMHPDWARSLRDQCKAAVVPFLFKQWGVWLDAELCFDRVDGRAPGIVCADGSPWVPDRPLNFTDAAILADILGHAIEHHSDGNSYLRLGKKDAGRLLDGVEHTEFPEVRR